MTGHVWTASQVACGSPYEVTMYVFRLLLSISYMQLQDKLNHEDIRQNHLQREMPMMGKVTQNYNNIDRGYREKPLGHEVTQKLTQLGN